MQSTYLLSLMKIIPSTLTDINEIFSVYDAAIAYQIALNKRDWSGFESALIEKEINENRHFKIMEGDDLACTFVIDFKDPVIWKDSDDVKAIYLHRIATHPNFRGRLYVKKIVEWARDFGKQRGMDFIRMDTKSGNERLNNYYIRSGFTHKGLQEIEWTSDLPAHYKNGSLSLFEIKIIS